MKKISTFLTLALVALVAFVSCAEPKYSDKMIDVEPKVVEFDMDESDGTWTVKDGYGAKSTVADGVVTIAASGGYTQTVFKFKNPGSTKAIIEYTSTGPVTFGVMAPTSDPWGKRIDQPENLGSPYDVNADAERKATEVEVKFPADKDVGFITVGSNGDPTNVIKITKITTQ